MRSKKQYTCISHRNVLNIKSPGQCCPEKGPPRRAAEPWGGVHRLFAWREGQRMQWLEWICLYLDVSLELWTIYLFVYLFIYFCFLLTLATAHLPPPFFSFQLRKLEKSRDFKRVVWMKVAWPRNMYKTTLLFCCSHLLLPPCLLLWLQVWSLNAVVCMSVLGGSTQVENNASEVASQWAHVI